MTKCMTQRPDWYPWSELHVYRARMAFRHAGGILHCSNLEVVPYAGDSAVVENADNGYLVYGKCHILTPRYKPRIHPRRMQKKKKKKKKNQ